MKASDLKEAQTIVAAIEWLETALRHVECESASMRLKTRSTGPTHRPSATDYALGIPAREAALKVQRDEWTARIAAHRRRAAQISLFL